MCFSHYLGIGCEGGGVVPKGLVHNLLMQFFNLGRTTIQVSENCFFDIVSRPKDHPTYVKHI